MMNKIFATALVGMAISIPASAFAQTWNMPTPYSDKVFHTANIIEFAKDVKAATNGALNIIVHSAGSLYKHAEIKNAVRSGQVPIGEFFLSRLSNENAAFGIDSQPFVATSYADAAKLWAAQKPVVTELLAKQGLMVLFAVPWPPQGLYTNGEINSVADLAGLKFRAYNAALERFAALAGAGFKGKVLLEKPLFHKAGGIPGHSFSGAYVAYNLRFHPVIRRLKEIAQSATVHAAHAYVGQHISQWRPDTDYRHGYSARKSEGGGVLRDLSHELDYLNWILGGWKQLTAAGGHFSDLEIDSDDIFSILLETENCPVATVQMNYLDAAPRREVILLTDKGSFHADLIAGRVNSERLKTGIDDTVIAEHKAVLGNDESVICSLEEGMEVLHMIEAAEKAAHEKIWVSR